MNTDEIEKKLSFTESYTIRINHLEEMISTTDQSQNLRYLAHTEYGLCDQPIDSSFDRCRI